MSNALYDKLKFVAQILLPALGTLYFTLAGIWNLPAAEAVVGTIVAIDTFLGVLLHVSTGRYNIATEKPTGDIVITEKNGVKTYSLELTGKPEEIEKKSLITFQVVKRKT